MPARVVPGSNVGIAEFTGIGFGLLPPPGESFVRNRISG
jgi:hypothetical protein